MLMQVNETKRTTMFDNGKVLSLHNVKEVDFSGNYLRLVADEGYVLINPAKVLYHVVPTEARVR